MALTAIALGTALATGPTATALALAELHATGARILLDDFGTGFSSLSYVQRLPLDGRKIDRSFVQHVTTSPRVRTLVAAMLAMAEGLDLVVVAEGIETQEVADVLAHLGCRTAQGYLWAEPSGPCEFARSLSGPAAPVTALGA